jgi:branched-chain amino acid transport system substrate-binding protein
MRKWIATIGAAATAAMLVSTASADTVKVGVISTFSGGFARWGEQFKQAIEVYQAQHGKAVNGHTIEIVYRDDGGPDPAKARQLAEELILREKVQFIAGFPWSPNALAVAELITEAKMPTIIFNAATSVITRRSPYFVRSSFTLSQDTVPIARWAPKNGIKTAVIAVADYAPGLDAENFFSSVFKAEGGEILESIRVPLATTDFSPFFERVLQKKPDALFMFGPGGPGSVGMINTWASRLKPAGIKLLVTNETQQLDLPSIGKAAVGVVGSSHYTESNDNPLNKKLWADLTRMFGPDRVPDTASVSAYDGMHLIYAVVGKLGPKFNPDEAMKVMAGMRFDSPRGPIVIDAKERDIIQNVYLRRVEERDGKLINVDFETVPMVKDPWKELNPPK